MRLFRRALLIFCVSVGVVWTIWMAIFVFLVFVLFGERRGHKAQRAWGRGLLFLFGIHLRVEGLENIPTTAVVVAPNHESMFDIMVLAALPIDFKWISKAEVRKYPFVGFTIHRMGAYFVNRDRSGKDLNVMKEVEEGLKAGKSVVIFPEGTRTRTGEMLPFKKGAFRTAQNSGAPLLPLAIKGTFKISKPNELPSSWGSTVEVRIGHPFPVSKDADLVPVMADYRKCLMHLLQEGRAT